MLFLLIAGFVAIILIDVPPLLLYGRTRELWAFWAVLTASFLLCLAILLRWPIPNPTRVLEAIFTPAARALGLR